MPDKLRQKQTENETKGAKKRQLCARISYSFPPFGTVQNPVRVLMTEHDAAGDFLREMRELTDDFTAPENACASYKSLYFGLEELEKDLHQHIHLENNVLFPAAVELERKVLFGVKH